MTEQIAATKAPNAMKTLFSKEKVATRVVKIPITDEDVREVAITDETHNRINELRARMVEKHASMTEDNETENRRLLKEMVDDGFTTLFDEDTAKTAYELSGSEVMAYTSAYVEVLDFIGQQFEQRANSEVFAKYAPHLKK